MTAGDLILADRGYCHRRGLAAVLDLVKLKAAAFFFVLTSVPRQTLSAEKALELYRLRWQIEMAFKRMKGPSAPG